MNPRHFKLAIAAAVVVTALLLLAATEKIGNFFTIMGNIATNLAHAEHGDSRDLDSVTAEFIKSHTGSTDRVDEATLPKALRPIKKYAHPPFSMGACQICHAPTRSKPAAIQTPHAQTLCYRCHIPLHKPAETVDCNSCHNPHHADREMLLRDKVTERVCPVGKFETEGQGES